MLESGLSGWCTWTHQKEVLMRGWICLALTATLLSCGSDSKKDDLDLVSDVGGDGKGDVVEDLRGDGVPSDTVAGDQADVVQSECLYSSVPQDTPDVNQKKFALTMFHFNIQYVVGGLDAETPDGETVSMCGALCKGWSDDKLNDWYITAVFEPVIDVFLKHPSWRVTFEFQGLLLDVMRQRHPEALAKLQQASQQGTVEVVSLHYSDQFFLAFPRVDLQNSLDLNRRVFEESCVPMSPVVFNQEGQSGEGKHRFMKENGYGISVFPVNLWRYYHLGLERALFYTDRGMDVVVGPGEGYRSDLPLVFETDAETGIEVTWTFFDDGDLLAYPPSPYLAPLYTPEEGQANLAEYEAKLVELEEQGFKITSVTDYVAHLKAQGVEQPALPPVLDGTWQPVDTDSVHRWLGGRSVGASNHLERDNEIRKENYAISRDLEAASRLLATVPAGTEGRSALEEKLASAYVHLHLAEVSDATGITPWIGEFYYGQIHNREARAAGLEVWTGALGLLGWKHASVDFETGAVTEMEELPVYEAPEEVDAPMELEVNAPTRETTLKWYGGPDVYVVRFGYGPGEDPTGEDETKTAVSLGFPRTETGFMYSPALAEDEVVSYPFESFTFQNPEVYLPLSNGLIGLGGDWWVIKHCAQIHVAARVPTDANEQYIQFVDETADPVELQQWVFSLVHGTQEEALAEARRINTHPLFMK